MLSKTPAPIPGAREVVGQLDDDPKAIFWVLDKQSAAETHQPPPSSMMANDVGVEFEEAVGGL